MLFLSDPSKLYASQKTYFGQRLREYSIVAWHKNLIWHLNYSFEQVVIEFAEQLLSLITKFLKKIVKTARVETNVNIFTFFPYRFFED